MANQSNGKTVYDVLGRNPVHPFPARMAPGIAFNAVSRCREPLRILDPMSGSGTVLAIACAEGHRATGVDIDPLAVLISKVWITATDSSVLRKQANDVLDAARQTFASLKDRDAYPENSDEEAKRFVKFWFDDHARRQLASLASTIGTVRDEKIRNALWCAFSRLIITKNSGASLAMDLSHSRPHKVFRRAPSEPFRKFLSAVDHIACNCIDSSHDTIPETCICEGDARDLDLDDGSIDLILTSPPYLNAIDYIRCSKFSLVWMGYTISHLRNLRSTSIGAEAIRKVEGVYVKNILSKLDLRPKLQPKHEAILIRYIDDMRQVVRETARVLTNDGRATYVIGENTMHGTFIRNSRIIEELAKDVGLVCVERHSRELPPNRRYLPPPARSRHAPLDKRIRREVILTLAKTSSK